MHGAVLNKAFRLDGLTRAEFVRLEGETEERPVPGRDRILLDEEAARRARQRGSRCGR